MKLQIFDDYTSLCAAVADAVIRQLTGKPASVLVFPTGNTPLGLFKELVRLEQAGRADFSKAHVVVLDEYKGLEAGDPRSLTDWLKRELLLPTGVLSQHIHGFEFGPQAVEDKIKTLGGLDLVILGLGPNGHLGFNDPGSPFDSRARDVELAPASIASNAAYWGSEDRVPRQGQTLGLGTLAEARALIVMVSGAAKQGILKQTLEGPVSPDVPASLLRRLNQAALFVDRPSVDAR
jgi:glucosamine-6-phosphate deaminase